jgi:pimeloyl-ACP methyl ester carboxylesterase
MALSTFCNGTIFGERTGASPRVLALHGWGRDHRDWHRVLDGVPALLLDLPGFGASPAPREATGSEGYAEALLPVLDDIDVPAVVVGHSFGGRIALYLAAAAPEKVGALVLSGVPFRRPHSGGRVALGYRVVRGLRRARLVTETRMEAARQRYGSDDYRRAHGVMRDVLVRTVSESYEDVLGRLACPVELVWGTDDTAAPIEGARAVAAALPDARLTELAGDHFACFSQPEELRFAIDRAVSRLGIS